MRYFIRIVALAATVQCFSGPAHSASKSVYGPYRFICDRFPGDVRAIVSATLTKSGRRWSIEVCVTTSLIKREGNTEHVVKDHVLPCQKLEPAQGIQHGQHIKFPESSPAFELDQTTKVLRVGKGPDPNEWPPRTEECTNAVEPGLTPWAKSPKVCTRC